MSRQFFAIAVISLSSILANNAAADSACDLLCSPRHPQFEFKDLIQKVRVYGEVDRRGELSKVAKAFGIKPSEAANLRKAVGEIVCQSSNGLPSLTATAFVSGKSDEIISTAHGMIDAFNVPRDFSKCFFENFEIPPRRIQLIPNSPRNIFPKRAINGPSDLGLPDDRIRLKLLKAVPNVRPLNPGDQKIRPDKGTPLLLVGAEAEDFRYSGKDPIISKCEIQDVVSPGDGVSRIKSDCSSDHGNSGGPYLYRDPEGMLRVVAIHLRRQTPSDVDLPNNSPYSDSNAAVGLVIDQEFASWFKDK